MDVARTILDQFRAFKEARRQYSFDFIPPAPLDAGYTVHESADGCDVSVRATDVGVDTVDVREIWVAGPPDSESSATLSELSDRLIGIPLPDHGGTECVELDTDAGQAVLRSVIVDGAYYEMMLAENEVMLRHYTVVNGKRARSSTTLTDGDFCKLVSSLVAFVADAAAATVES